MPVDHQKIHRWHVNFDHLTGAWRVEVFKRIPQVDLFHGLFPVARTACE
jgi:hypothetical protein